MAMRGEDLGHHTANSLGMLVCVTMLVLVLVLVLMVMLVSVVAGHRGGSHLPASIRR